MKYTLRCDFLKLLERNMSQCIILSLQYDSRKSKNEERKLSMFNPFMHNVKTWSYFKNLAGLTQQDC